MPDAPVQHAHQNDHAAIGVEPRIENQRAQRRVGRALGRRHQMDDGFQNFVNADALLGAGQNGAAGIEPDDGFDLLADALRLRRRQIDLVDHRNDLQIVVQRQVRIRQRLRFHALRRVHHQQRALAGLQAARNLVGEIDVARRVDEVQLIHLAVVGAIVQAHGVGLDGDAALALQIHGVEHLLHHFALRQSAGGLQQTIRQRGFAVVDMRNDREIADEFAIHGELRGAEPIIPQTRVSI